MAKRPTVPFDLHTSLRLVRNMDVDHGFEAVLSPDGQRVGVLRGEWNHRKIEVHELSSGAVTDATPAGCAGNLEHFTWSRDGARWAAVELRFDGQERRGDVYVGALNDPPAHLHRAAPGYLAVTRNGQQRAAPLMSFAPDGESLTLRLAGSKSGPSMFHLSLRDLSTRELGLGDDACDPYAQAFTDDGTLFALSADAGDVGGLAAYRPGEDLPTRRLPWVTGCALLATRTGLWAVGLPRICFRVGSSVASNGPHEREACLSRLDVLEARARSKWDREYLAMVRERLSDSQVSYHLGRDTIAVGPPPASLDGARAMENELFWETSFAARFGDDDLLVSDGVALWHWTERAEGLARTLLLDDPARCSHIRPRILGMSTAGSAVAVLWRKDAQGARTVLSLFDLDGTAIRAGTT